MRTKEEAFAILESYRLSMSDSERVMGFLLGKGVIEKGEIVKFGGYDGRKGGELHIITFDDFYEWFEADEEFKILEGLLNFLQDEQDKALEAGDTEKANTLASYLGFLVEELELEYEEVRGDEVNDEK
jgi:hypothetical protein